MRPPIHPGMMMRTGYPWSDQPLPVLLENTKQHVRQSEGGRGG